MPASDAGSTDAGEASDSGTGATDAGTGADGGTDAGFDAGLPGRRQDYRATTASYVAAFIVPPKDPETDRYTCCRDFNGDGFADNGWVRLFASMEALSGPNLQQQFTDAVETGQLAIILDHRGLGSAGEPFELAWLESTFGPSTDYAQAAAGAGTFAVSKESFVTGTDRPLHPLQARLAPDLSAEGETARVAMPFGGGLLPMLVEDVRLEAQASAASTYSGALSGVVTLAATFEAMNSMLAAPLCECLELTEPVFFHDGTNWAARCVPDVESRCPDEAQLPCRTLAGSYCSLFPPLFKSAIDVDRNGDGVNDAFSLGLQWRGVPAADVRGCIPSPNDSCSPCAVDSDCASFELDNLCEGRFGCLERNCEVDPATRVVCEGEGDGPCRPMQCVPATGLCEIGAQPDGTECGGDLCQTSSTCQQGECVGSGEPIACDDLNPCTSDLCDPLIGCFFEMLVDGTPCDDGIPETVDYCHGGECLPAE